jgi:hypothetical protein
MATERLTRLARLLHERNIIDENVDARRLVGRGCSLKIWPCVGLLVCLIAEVDAGEGVVGGVFEPVAVAFEGVDVGVVEDAVDHGGGNSLVAENLRDRLDAGSLPAGATIRILVRPPVQLGNRGGLITLLDSSGLKVDGVAYTQTHAAEGWSVVF